jgi:two-component system chemotaxis response regulator CheB
LPKEFPVPLLIVQHIASGFLSGLADWLNQTTGLKVHIAAHGKQPVPGHVYLAPDDFHLAVRTGGVLALNRGELESGLRPSVAHLFRSLADVHGPNAIGVLLTGMGKDGAQDLKRMNNRGAITIVQDRDTSVVHGMPGEAIALGAATHILPVDRIAGALTMIVNQYSAS